MSIGISNQIKHNTPTEPDPQKQKPHRIVDFKDSEVKHDSTETDHPNSHADRKPPSSGTSELHISVDLVHLAEESLLKEQPLPTIEQISREFTGSVLQDETKQDLFLGRIYKGGIKGQCLRVQIHRLELFLQHPHFRETERVRIKIELNPEGEKHEYVFAQKARYDDPAARLAFQATGLDADGRDIQDIVEYLFSKGQKMVHKANSFVDTLEGISDQQIAETSRRYLYYHRSTQPRQGLEKFIGGGHTE